jgi:hypothetical protein
MTANADKPNSEDLRRFEARLKALLAVPNSEVQAALAEEKRTKAEGKRAKD